MLDYGRVKAEFMRLLAEKLEGRGRVESAAYHAAEFAYLKGVEDGLAAAGVPDDERKRIIGLVG